MAPPPTLDHASNTYLALTFPPTSPYIQNPSSLKHLSPPSEQSENRAFQLVQLHHVSQVGELEDSHIYQVDGVDKTEWERVKDQVLGALKGDRGVRAVQELKPRVRVKRDEF